MIKMSKIMNILDNLLGEVDDDEKLDVGEFLGFNPLAISDRDRIFLVEARTDVGKLMLYPFANKERLINKKIEIPENEKGGQASFRKDYLFELIKIAHLDTEKDEITIETAEDWPIKIYSDNFILILAPRVKGVVE